jgi:niacin transporter
MNNNRNKVYKMTITALLCAIGILIPLISPIKIVLEPASYTLGSHIPIFIAMFISPLTAVIVALGTTVGFFFAGFPIVVVLRAASHLVFALIGALIIQKNRQILDKPLSALTFSFLIGILHGAVEMAVVIPFYFGNMMQAYYAKGFIVSIVLLVGVGTIIHSMFDFWISLFIWKPLRKVIKIPEIQNSKAI